jgi:hypothetical protein
MDRLYCSVSEILEDIGDPAKPEAFILGKIEAASQEIERHVGQFLPSIETRYFEGEGDEDILVPPLLSVSSLVNGTATLASTDYNLEPDGRHWRNGPYSEIEIAETGTAGAWSTSERGVAVTGHWGMWEEAVSVQLTAVIQLVGDTTIVVSDGSKVSPGMVLLIGSEWELVTGTAAASDSTANLITAISDTDEELSVINGSLLSAGEVIRIGFERMQVLEVLGNDVQVSRGFLGSKRSAHLAGADIYVFRTFNVRRGVNGSTAAAHSSAAVQRQVAPADVNYLCRQIAALMIKKAQTGYVGRAGSDELGGGFWLNEFPRNQIDTVKSNYFWGGR